MGMRLQSVLPGGITNHSSSSSSTGDGSIAEGADALSAMRETAIDNGNSLCGPLTGTLCHSTSHDMPIVTAGVQRDTSSVKVLADKAVARLPLVSFLWV